MLLSCTYSPAKIAQIRCVFLISFHLSPSVLQWRGKEVFFSARFSFLNPFFPFVHTHIHTQIRACCVHVMCVRDSEYHRRDEKYLLHLRLSFAYFDDGWIGWPRSPSLTFIHSFTHTNVTFSTSAMILSIHALKENESSHAKKRAAES